MNAQQFTISQFLDEANHEAREELETITANLLGWSLQNLPTQSRLDPNLDFLKEFWVCPSGLRHYDHPYIDHNLAAKVRETVIEIGEVIMFINTLDNFVNPNVSFHQRKPSHELGLLNSSPTQQIVSALIAKGIIK